MAKGKLHKIGKLDVLELSGSYRGMGCEYGRLMKEKLRQFYEDAISKHFLGEKGWSKLMLNIIARILFMRYPRRFKEIIYGISDTSGMSVSELIILEQVVLFPFAMENLPFQCSVIAVWDDYTSGRPLVFGRNFDLHECFQMFSEFVTLVVFNPDDNSIPVASIGYAGQIGINTAMNHS